MKAVQFPAVGEVRMVELPDPTPGPGEVLVRVAAAGICHTDVHILHGNFPARYPVVPGHEFAGTVVAAGDGVDPSWVGRRVAVDPNVPCGTCPACKENRQNLCPNLEAYGVTLNGGFAELATVKLTNAYLIGDLPFKVAAMAEPLACVVHGLNLLRLEPASHALIFGAGPMGLLLMQALKHAGAARATLVDLHHRRLEIGLELGADATLVDADGLQELAPEHGRFDLVADATGVPAVVERLPRYVRDGGKILYFGVCPPDAEIRLKPYDVYRRDLQIIGSFSLRQTLAPALRLLASGAVRVEPLISHTFQLDEFEHWIQQVGKAETMKLQAVLE
ncbi:zinc-dependent alcohol dehydrogenase family protein [Limnochorda pilosa]|uniref:Zinc-binding dehydrogenase n=1 Tax=Limnochorda pilosa TaxID=1555112 RepID=A0A0K2SM02_LIMPI|nr:zinc-dependent alcohol dehydrogenase family protein [Limnochorda pilosa]BAS28042.1 zinc-binding dehydrogenase [Limnochorda pilosa]